MEVLVERMECQVGSATAVLYCTSIQEARSTKGKALSMGLILLHVHRINGTFLMLTKSECAGSLSTGTSTLSYCTGPWTK